MIRTADMDHEPSTTIFGQAKNQCNNLSLNTVSHESGEELLHCMLTQHSVKNGLKIFGEADITIDELNQSHSRAVLEQK